MENSKKGYLPIDHEISLSKKDYPITPEEREHMSRVPYASAVGSIMYAMTCTRPDVAYSLGVVSRYQSDPGEDHWKVVKAILKYLRNTKDQWLVYGESDLKLVGFTDSSFQSDHDDSRSVSGYIFTLNGGAICWKSFKQHTMADSICEAEYIATLETMKEAGVAEKIHHQARSSTLPRWSSPALLRQHWCHRSGEGTQSTSTDEAHLAPLLPGLRDRGSR